jgi:thiosulfate/3-mercaptopyruvate sulfurtransferase
MMRRDRLGILKRREHGVIVDAAWVAAHLADPKVEVVELDVSRASYDAGHIPGAVLWNAYSDLRDSSYTPIGHAELERLLSRSGISPDTTLVFYGYGAVLGLWLMKAHGHADLRMLAGPREQWTEAGGEWSTDVPEPLESSYPLAEAKADTLASRSAAEAAIGDPRRVLLDVRAESEYDGERFWPSGATEDVGRAGHIPGAVSLPIGLMCNEDETLKPAEELRLLLDGAGITSDVQVITYCTIGNRASRAWFALKYLLDYPDVSVYYGSWVEWGKAADTPIEP